MPLFTVQKDNLKRIQVLRLAMCKAFADKNTELAAEIFNKIVNGEQQ